MSTYWNLAIVSFKIWMSLCEYGVESVEFRGQTVYDLQYSNRYVYIIYNVTTNVVAIEIQPELKQSK